MTKITDFFDRVLDYLAYLLCALVFFVFVIVSTEVTVRYLLNLSIGWVLEVTEYVIVTVTFLGIAWVLREEGHVCLDVVLNLFETKKQAAINTFTSILCAIVCFVIFWYSAASTWDHFQRGTIMIEKMLELPKAPFLAVLPIGFFLFFIQFLRRSYRNLRIWRVPSKKGGERIE